MGADHRESRSDGVPVEEVFVQLVEVQRRVQFVCRVLAQELKSSPRQERQMRRLQEMIDDMEERGTN